MQFWLTSKASTLVAKCHSSKFTGNKLELRTFKVYIHIFRSQLGVVNLKTLRRIHSLITLTYSPTFPPTGRAA